MCGIFGYYHYDTPTTVGKIVNLTLDGLKRLEYRGYDSSGICVDDPQGGAVIVKSVGNVSNLHKKVNSEKSLSEMTDNSFKSSSSIAHTRWATHGHPCDINAHPHTSDDSNLFVVVHNGIISNFNSLRHFLKDQGYELESLTDTEVIPKLCKYVYDRNPDYNFTEVVSEVVNKLEGTFAVLVKSRAFPAEFIACKQGSPLIVGLMNENEFVFSSDISAIIDHTNIIVTLDDNDLLHVAENSMNMQNFKTNESKSWMSSTVHATKSDILKGDYATFMEKEIMEQPITLKKTMYGRTHGNQVSLKELQVHKQKIMSASKFVLIACGTSYNSCLGSRCVLEGLLGIPVFIECASDFVDRSPIVSPNDVYIFVSQSGETADTLQALKHVKSNDGFTIVITNKHDSAIARQGHVSINLNVGFEISVASTKAYTSQLLMFVMVAMTLSNRYVDVHNLPEVVDKTINKVKSQVELLAKRLVEYQSMLFIGRGNNYATALESALKVKEIAYIHSEGMLAGELKHGPLALIDDRVMLVVFVTKDDLYEKMISVVQQLKARRANMIVICNEDDDVIPTMVKADSLVKVPVVDKFLQHIVNAVPMQLLAYYMASLQNHNVDQPRNLAKSVTVSD